MIDCESSTIGGMKWDTLQDRLKWAMQRSNITQVDLTACGVTKQAVNQWVNGPTQRLAGKSLLCAARMLKVSPEWLNLGRGSPDANFASTLPDFRQIPVISYVQAGQFSAIHDEHPAGYGMDMVTTNTENLGENAFALRIKGESMLPEFKEGDLVIIDPSLEPIPGDLVVARNDGDNAATFKKYRPLAPDSAGYAAFDLVPLNEDWPTIHITKDNPGSIVGVMVEHRKFRSR